MSNGAAVFKLLRVFRTAFDTRRIEIWRCIDGTYEVIKWVRYKPESRTSTVTGSKKYGTFEEAVQFSTKWRRER